jgi:AcrR family transcriptional regulator
MSATTPQRRVSADERRALILRVAGPLFARHGYAATRLEDIAAAAQVTKPIVYRHFESKKGLYLALLQKHRDDLPTFIQGVRPPADGEGPDRLVRAILEIWLDYVRENQHAWVMLFRDHSGDEEIRAFRTDVSLRAREVMAGFITAVPGPALPQEQVQPTAEVLTSGLAGLALWWIDHPDTPKPVLVEVAARISAAAVGVGRAG